MIDQQLVFGKKKWRWFSKEVKIHFTNIISEIWGLVDPFFQTPQAESFVEAALESGDEGNLYPLIDWTMERGTNQEKLQLGEVVVIVQCFLQIRGFTRGKKRREFHTYGRATIQVNNLLECLRNVLAILGGGFPADPRFTGRTLEVIAELEEDYESWGEDA